MRLIPLLIAVLLPCPAAAAAQQGRVFTVDDLLALEQLAHVEPSPDGRWLAVVIKRAKTEDESYQTFFISENNLSDVWLVPTEAGEPRRITDGYLDGSGFWNPVWSPDGRRLALLSSRGDDNVRPYVWEMRTSELVRLTERGVDLWSIADVSDAHRYPWNPFVWADERTLLVSVVPPGEADPNFTFERRGPDTLMRAWPKAVAGTEPTASVLDSDPDAPLEPAGGALLRIDVVRRDVVELARGDMMKIFLSSAGDRVAFVASAGTRRPEPDRPLRFDDALHTRLGMVPLSGGPAEVRWVDEVEDPRGFSLDAPHSWSPDGDRLAMIARPGGREDSPETLFVVEGDRARRMLPTGWKASDVVWSGAGRLLVRAEGPGGPDGWWLSSAGRPPRLMTAGLPAVPQRLWRAPEGRLVGLATGELWALDPQTGGAEPVTGAFELEIDAVVWPRALARARALGDEGRLIVRAGDRLYRLELGGGAVRSTELPLPHKEADLAAFHPASDLVVLTAWADDGSFLWTARVGEGPARERMRLNTHLAEVAAGEVRELRYRSLDGDSLRGAILLPPGYEEGERVPLVTRVYGGWMLRGGVEGIEPLNRSTALNLQLLAARGYAVLYPSMPLEPEGRPSDPYMDMLDGVMSAVERAIEMGVADPERLALLGNSYGGYSVYSIITQTDRFDAAVALAGFNDLITQYGLFDARDRYTDRAHERLRQATFAESFQLRMGGSLYDDLWRYVRNSPLFYVHRVETPLMIVQGDQDFVSMEQGEEFFTALYRLGKRARFVRYWGEGHAIQSPANIRDLWGRMSGWFDELLK